MERFATQIAASWAGLLIVLSSDAASAASKKDQDAILKTLDENTTSDAIKDAYGPPKKKIKSQYDDKLTLLLYSGVNHDLYIVMKDGEFTGNFAISSDNKETLFPILGKAFSHYTLGTVAQECHDAKAGGADARWAFFLVGDCYFGRPGGYKYYQFGYEASRRSGGMINCVRDPLEWESQKISKAGCDKAALSIRPDFIYASGDENDEVGSRIQYIINWPEERQF